MAVTREDIAAYLERRQCWDVVPGKLDTPCWIWNGCLNRPGGYGLCKINKTQITSNRAAYLAWVGEIPDELDVLHWCDTPPCVNPPHLYAGTHQQNMDDIYRRRRRKLKHTVEQRIEVRRLRDGGMGMAEISELTGINISTCYSIYNQYAIRPGEGVPRRHAFTRAKRT